MSFGNVNGDGVGKTNQRGVERLLERRTKVGGCDKGEGQKNEAVGGGGMCQAT